MRNTPAHLSYVFVLSFVVLSGCATNGSGNTAEAQDAGRLDRYNRSMHNFNRGLHRRVFHPIGKGVNFIVPEPVEGIVGAISENLSVPNTAFNNLLQGKPGAAGQDLARFGINTVLGIGGIFDWASRWGIPDHQEDFGQTLGRYGVGQGGYFVMPVLGGATPRDLFGGLVALDINYFLDSDDLVTYQTIETGVGLAAAADMPELPGYDDQRAMYLAERECSVHDGADSAAESCQRVCDRMAGMIRDRLATMPKAEREAMLAEYGDPREHMPAFCRSEANLTLP